MAPEQNTWLSFFLVRGLRFFLSIHVRGYFRICCPKGSLIHGRKSRGTWGRVLPEFGVVDANTNCPPPRVLSCFKISSTRLLALQALQCSKRFTNHMTLTENSLLPKNRSSTSTKSPLQVEIQHWQGHGQNYRSECIKTCHFKWTIIFFLGKVPSSDPSPDGRSTLAPTSHQAFWMCICIPQPDLHHCIHTGCVSLWCLYGVLRHHIVVCCGENVATCHVTPHGVNEPYELRSTPIKWSK